MNTYPKKRFLDGRKNPRNKGQKHPGSYILTNYDLRQIVKLAHLKIIIDLPTNEDHKTIELQSLTYYSQPTTELSAYLRRYRLFCRVFQDFLPLEGLRGRHLSI